jgi:parallel beta-helix repeat protein
MNVSRKGLRAALAALVLVVAGGLGSATAGATSGELYLTSNTTLKEDHQGTIFINADNVTLDCAGHAVLGPGLIGIDVYRRSHVTIRNCRVSGFFYGVILQESASDLVTGNTVSDSTRVGISSYSLTDSTFSGNVVSRNAIGFFAVALPLLGEQSARNTLTANTASGNSGYGFELVDLQDSDVVGNIASGNAWSGFTAFTGPAYTGQTGLSSSRFVANRSDANGGHGFMLVGASNITLSQNSATNNGAVGIWLSGSTGSTLTGNTAGANRWAGVELVDAASSYVVGNTSTGNGGDGFTVYGLSTANRLLNNIASGNSGDGFGSYAAKGNVYLGNRASGNQNGFALLDGSAQNSLTGNVAFANLTGFFVVRGSTGNALTLSIGHGNTEFDAQDGNPTGANSWKANSFGTSSPPGLGLGRTWN